METDQTRRLDHRRLDKGRSRRWPTADAAAERQGGDYTQCRAPAHPYGRGPSSEWIHRIPQRLHRRPLPYWRFRICW